MGWSHVWNVVVIGWVACIVILLVILSHDGTRQEEPKRDEDAKITTLRIYDWQRWEDFDD